MSVEDEKPELVWDSLHPETYDPTTPQVTMESLEEMFELVEAATKERKEAPVRFKKDGPLIYPREHELWISEKFRDTPIAKALLFKSWAKVKWTESSLDTGGICAIPTKMLDPKYWARPGQIYGLPLVWRPFRFPL